MFKQARRKLTAWYLVIIMAISLSFSSVIFFGINRELDRIEHVQQTRQEERQELGPILDQLKQERAKAGLSTPPFPRNFNTPDPQVISEVRTRLIVTLGVINLTILGISGLAGYFLAGRTLQPIKVVLDEQKEFVSNASHELRTPLTSLKTEIEVALRDKGRTLADSTALLRSNLEEVNKMQKLSNYLLELNRYELGRNIPMSKVDLKEVALNAIGKRKVKTDLRKSIIVGNQDALIELVTILLDNAFKYGQKKEVSVRTSERTIEVADHGVGIAKEDLPHIFDRFYRSDKSRGTDGYGLGLSIAKSIVDVHGGKISIESKLDRGSTFTVLL